MSLIIYPLDDETVAVMTANEKLLANLSMLEIAKKHVPNGKKFKIIEREDLPDETFWPAWRVDFDADNDGVGEA